MEIQAAILAITLSGLFCFIVGWQLSRMLIKGRIWEIIREETWRRIQDLEFENNRLETIVNILTGQRDDAMMDAERYQNERNEAMLLITKELSKEALIKLKKQISDGE